MAKKKRNRQSGTMKLNQHVNGLVSVSVSVHRGRVTQKVFGPMSDDAEMALELFKSGIKSKEIL